MTVMKVLFHTHAQLYTVVIRNFSIFEIEKIAALFVSNGHFNQIHVWISQQMMIQTTQPNWNLFFDQLKLWHFPRLHQIHPYCFQPYNCTMYNDKSSKKRGLLRQLFYWRRIASIFSFIFKVHVAVWYNASIFAIESILQVFAIEIEYLIIIKKIHIMAFRIFLLIMLLLIHPLKQ